MATALRINASSEPPSSPLERKRNSTDSHDGNNDKRNSSVMSDKYVHVHHYLDTGRWGTWFNDPTLKRGSGKRRLYFGTYETEYLAARAQDRAALKFKPDAVRPITRLNFAESDYDLDKDLRDKLTHGQFRRLLMAESRKCYKRAEPSPCWRIFLEEAAKGNIHIEYGNRPNRHHRNPRTFEEVLQEILNKNEAVNVEEITEPIHEPVSTGEEELKVYTAKRTKRPTHAAPNQPAQEVTKELTAEESVDRASLRTENLSARQVRKATPVAVPSVHRDARSASLSASQVREPTPTAAPTVRRDARSANLSARPVRKATPKAAPAVRCDARSASLSASQVREPTPTVAPTVRRDARSANLSARPVRKATPKAAPAIRCDVRSASLSAPQVRKATPNPVPPVVRRDARSPRQSARPVPKGAPAAAPPVRLEPSISRRVRREGQSALQTSEQISVYLDRLDWGRTRGRSVRNFNKISLPNAASTDEVTVAADSLNNILMAANILSEATNGTSGTSDGKVALGGDHTTVENPSKRGRLNIDLNREPEPSSTAGAVAPPYESDAIGGNDDQEVSSAESLLLLLKSGWLK